MRFYPRQYHSMNYPRAYLGYWTPKTQYFVKLSTIAEGKVLFAVEIRDHIMIAHSLHGTAFGPAQALHGATFIVAVAFVAEALNPDGVVVDIGRAHTVLKEVLAPLNYRNLDELAEMDGKNTTTEFLAKHIFDRLSRCRPFRVVGTQ